MNAECHACNKVIAYDDEAVCCKGYCYHKECRCLICGKLSDEQEEIAQLRRALEKAAEQMNHFTDCPSYTWNWQNQQKGKTDCKEWCDNKDETTSACWLQYFMEDE